jgi:hypothetical protein
MRLIPVVGAVFPVVMLLAACSSAPAAVPAVAASSPTAAQACTSAVQAWLHGRGGTTFHTVLMASSSMVAALKSRSQAKVGAAAQNLNSAAQRADGYLPPACANLGYNYQLAMGDWMIGATDAMGGNLKGTSSRLANGASEIYEVTVLRRLSPTVLKRLSRRVVIASTAPTTEPAVTSAPPATTPPASVTPAGCYPISDEGTCYEPGEYCRDADHGASGIAGDGEAITCEDNDGWRWEPS